MVKIELADEVAAGKELKPIKNNNQNPSTQRKPPFSYQDQIHTTGHTSAQYLLTDSKAMLNCPKTKVPKPNLNFFTRSEWRGAEDVEMQTGRAIPRPLQAAG